MRDDMEKFAVKGVKPFGVNPASTEKHLNYVKKMGFQYPLLSDANREVAAAYGALKSNGKSINRCVVVVGQDGKVIYSELGLPSDDQILAAI